MTESRSIWQQFPRAFWVANVMEIFERMGWYGFYAVSSLYLTGSIADGMLGFSSQDRGVIQGLATFFLYLFPAVFGALADRYGYKAMFLASCIVMAPGYLLLGEIIERTTGDPLRSAVRHLAKLDEIGLDKTWWDEEETPAPDGGTEPDAGSSEPAAGATPDAGSEPDAGATPDASSEPEPSSEPESSAAPSDEPQQTPPPSEEPDAPEEAA